MTQTITAIEVEVQIEVRNDEGKVTGQPTRKILAYEAFIPPEVMAWIAAQLKGGPNA